MHNVSGSKKYPGNGTNSKHDRVENSHADEEVACRLGQKIISFKHLQLKNFSEHRIL